jgi:hypothetical protein
MPTAYGNLGWTERSVKDLTRNRVYLGVAFHGEFENPVGHEPLTTPEVFARARREGARSTSQ